MPRGLCFGLLGPNGAGKTTTLRMIYGVTRPTAGTISVFDLDIAQHARAVRARLGDGDRRQESARLIAKPSYAS